MAIYLNSVDFSTIEIKEIEPNEDRAQLMVSDLKYLKTYDIKNFNYYNFEQDLFTMSDGEFEWWYTKTFTLWLEDLNEEYLDIELSDVYNRFESSNEKKLFLKKIVQFVMVILPYTILRNILHQDNDLNNINDLLNKLKDTNHLIEFRGELIEELNKNITEFEQFVETISTFEKISKKNIITENMELLDEHIKKQNFFIEIFKQIISECDMEKIYELLIKFSEADSENII